MSSPHDPSDQTASDRVASVDSVFDVDDGDPYETQQMVHRYLSQDTRHNILQLIIGHPWHLVSVTECEYYISKSQSTISEQLENLAEHEILTQYHHEPNTNSRDIPTDFWGLTTFGICLLSEYKYLRGFLVMRAVHDATHKPETVQRHQKAPRPSLPDSVRSALHYDELDPEESVPEDESAISTLREETFYADAAPAAPDSLNENADGDRTLGELF